MSPMDASVVVPTYNRRKSLERTLAALACQKVPSRAFEIIVVDDCSIDDTQEWMRQVLGTVSNLTYIRNSENQGRAVTRNNGIAAAQGDIIIFLDDDNVPCEEFVQAHIDVHEQEHEQHVAVMGSVRYAPEFILGSNLGKYLQSRYLGARSAQERSRLDYSNLPPRCFGTLNCSVRRADLITVGLLDTSFRYYGGEDEYLGYCLARAGVRIVFSEQARTVHYDEVSIRRYKQKILETSREGARVILDKSPEYFEGTQVRFLLPIAWKTDSLRRIAVKLVLRACLNPLTVSFLEQMLIATDRSPRLYLQPLYRMLIAGWILRGLRSKAQGINLVTYGEIR